MSSNETNVSNSGIIGSVAGSESTVSGNTINITNSNEKLSQNELISTLQKLYSELDKAKDIPPDEADDLKANLDAATKAVSKPSPNRPRAIEKLEGMQKILDSLKGSATSAIALGKLVGEAVVMASTLL